MLRIGISGICGRMGHAVYDCAQAEGDVQVICGIDHDQCRLPAAWDAELCSKAVQLQSLPQVFIDFSRPQCTQEVLSWAREHSVALVVGTTGLTAEQRRSMEECAREVPIVYAANFSVGVNILLSLAEKTAAVMADADLEIVETHHRFKADAPSGTALALAEAAARGRGRSLSELLVTDRAGQGGERRHGSIGLASLRGGDIVGEHRALFCADGERLELIHIAESRMNFARGALRAARWLLERPAGLYGMAQVLGL